MARKGNPILVRLDMNRSSNLSQFSEGNGLVFFFNFSYISNKKRMGGRCKCPPQTQLLLTLEYHWKTPDTRACRERSTPSERISTVTLGHG